MTPIHCTRCGRKLNQASASGMGPVCERMVRGLRTRAAAVYGKTAHAIGPGLFGFDVDAAAQAAQELLAAELDVSVGQHLEAMRRGERLGVRA